MRSLMPIHRFLFEIKIIKMAVRAQQVIGSFEKWAPGARFSKDPETEVFGPGKP